MTNTYRGCPEISKIPTVFVCFGFLFWLNGKRPKFLNGRFKTCEMVNRDDISMTVGSPKPFSHTFVSYFRFPISPIRSPIFLVFWLTEVPLNLYFCYDRLNLSGQRNSIYAANVEQPYLYTVNESVACVRCAVLGVLLHEERRCLCYQQRVQRFNTDSGSFVLGVVLTQACLAQATGAHRLCFHKPFFCSFSESRSIKLLA